MDNIQFTQIGTDNTGELFGDFLSGDSQVDIIDGLGGDDYINGNGGDDILYGWVGNDTVAGGIGNDILYGEEGSDRLIGSEYRGDYYNYPELYENPNAFANEPVDPDLIEVDDLYGGAGADTFVLGDYFSSHYRGLGFAIVRDFNPQEGDKLEIFGDFEDYTTSTNDLFGDGIEDTFISDSEGNWIAMISDYNNVLSANDFVSSQLDLNNSTDTTLNEGDYYLSMGSSNAIATPSDAALSFDDIIATVDSGFASNQTFNF